VRYSDRDQASSPIAQEGLGCMTFIRNLMWMTTGSIALIVVLAFGNAWQSGERLLGRLANLVNPPQPEPQVDVRSLVINQVRDASELTTAIFTMEAVVPTSQDQTLGGFLVGTTKLLYIAHGEVRAGVDLSQITPSDIEVEGDTIRLRLPPPRILDSKIDVSRSTVYDYDRGFLGLGPDVAPNLQALAEERALSRITQAACADNLLQRANERAKLVVTQLVRGVGDRSVIVETQPSDATACLAHVSPSAPSPQGLQSPAPPPLSPAPLEQPVPIQPAQPLPEQR